MSKALTFVLLGLALSAVVAMVGGGDNFEHALASAEAAGEEPEGPLPPMLDSDPRGPGRPSLVGRPQPKPKSAEDIAREIVEAASKPFIHKTSKPMLGTLIEVEQMVELEELLKKLKLEPWQREAIDRVLAYAREEMAHLKALRNMNGDSWNELLERSKRVEIDNASEDLALVGAHLANHQSTRMVSDGETFNELAERVYNDARERIEDVLDEAQTTIWSKHDTTYALRDLSFQGPTVGWSRIRLKGCRIDKLCEEVKIRSHEDA